MRLNRYLASSGKCSRRHADELVFSGQVKINGTRAHSPGIQVEEGDEVTLYGEAVFPIEEKHYLLMNKPPGVVTTMSDPQGRGTVKDLIKRAYGFAHLKPVGRLDQDTCGVLLFTDDGLLHHALTHPSRMVIKEYEVVLSRPLPPFLLKKLQDGITLTDGFLRPDFAGYRNPQNRSSIIIRLHSGKNRVIRRLMEELGVEIKLLRRLSFAGITVMKLKEGEMRDLTTKEVEGLQRLTALKNRN